MSTPNEITPEIMQTTINGVPSYQHIPVDNLITNLRLLGRVWGLRSATRRHLKQLDEHCLRDIGIEHRVAMMESKKWFWQK